MLSWGSTNNKLMMLTVLHAHHQKTHNQDRAHNHLPSAAWHAPPSAAARAC